MNRGHSFERLCELLMLQFVEQLICAKLQRACNLMHCSRCMSLYLYCCSNLNTLPLVCCACRTLGLHHLFVTAGEVPVVGLMTRSDMVPGAPEVCTVVYVFVDVFMRM